MLRSALPGADRIRNRFTRSGAVFSAHKRVWSGQHRLSPDCPGRFTVGTMFATWRSPAMAGPGWS